MPVSCLKVSRLPLIDMAAFEKAIRVVASAVVESKALLVQIAEQVKRFNGNVSAFDAPLEQTPEVFNAVSVNTTANVPHRD